MESLLLCPFAEPERLSDSGGVGGGCGDSNSRDIYRIPGLPSPYGKTILEEGVNTTVTAAASGTPLTHTERDFVQDSPHPDLTRLCPTESCPVLSLYTHRLCCVVGRSTLVFTIQILIIHSSSMGGTKGIDTSKKFRLICWFWLLLVWWFQQDRFETPSGNQRCQFD